MKVSTILVFPALALAAAVPAPEVEKRQLGTLDPTCLLGITGITACLGAGGVVPGLTLRSLLGCPINVILGALDCVIGGLPIPPLPIPVKE